MFICVRYCLSNTFFLSLTRFLFLALCSLPRIVRTFQSFYFPLDFQTQFRLSLSRIEKPLFV